MTIVFEISKSKIKVTVTLTTKRVSDQLLENAFAYSPKIWFEVDHDQ